MQIPGPIPQRLCFCRFGTLPGILHFHQAPALMVKVCSPHFEKQASSELGLGLTPKLLLCGWLGAGQCWGHCHDQDSPLTSLEVRKGFLQEGTFELKPGR